MLAEILPILQCPTCRADLAIAGDTATCPRDHAWPVEDGVLAFSRDDAPSDPWSRSFATYDKFVTNKRWAMSHFMPDVVPIIDELDPSAPGLCLDLCTGDGALLFNLLDVLGPASPVVSVDMSLHAQKYNRQYCSETQGGRPVDFISSDAAHLPFKDATVPRAVSFAMGNMLGGMADGIRETRRVLKPGGLFVFNHFFVEEKSAGWRTLVNALINLGHADFDYLGLPGPFEELMRTSGFSKYEIDPLEEVIGAPDRDTDAGPIFPYPNEPMRKILVKAWK